MRRIAVVVGSRANYASIKSVMRELKNRQEVDLKVFVGASALLGKFGNPVSIIESDGFTPDEKFYMVVEGENPETMAMSTGMGIIKLAGVFSTYKPDIVVVVGDRFEAMSISVAASFLNIRVAHTMGGEVTGTIDESIRHAVTKLAHIHFPANDDAAQRIIKMGENPNHVFMTGCPRIDVVREIVNEKLQGDYFDEEEFWHNHKGIGGIFPLKGQRFLLAMQHPVTTEFGDNRRNMREILAALNELKMPTIMLWPNADAGSDEISKEIRTFRERHKPDEWLHVFTNLPMETFLKLMDMCSCMVGNSSSAIRDGAIIGVPAVNVGTRQQGRVKGRNVIDVGYDRNAILAAIHKQLAHTKYEPDFIYGDGSAGKRVAKILAEVDLNEIPVQKQICY